MVRKKKVEVKKIDTIDISSAVELIKKNTLEKQRKFVETMDLIFNLNIDSKQSSQNIRGSVALPAGSGKDVKIIVFTDNESLQKDAVKAGALKAGMEELMAEIEGGFEGFDYCIATPSCMKNLSKVAKKLGPKGLMPNPKNGNVTDDVVNAIKIAKKGKVNFKNDKYGILHTMVGKVNFTTEDLLSNIKVVINAIKEMKPENLKGKFIKSVYLSSTMGLSVAIDIEKINSGEKHE